MEEPRRSLASLLRGDSYKEEETFDEKAEFISIRAKNVIECQKASEKSSPKPRNIRQEFSLKRQLDSLRSENAIKQQALEKHKTACASQSRINSEVNWIRRQSTSPEFDKNTIFADMEKLEAEIASMEDEALATEEDESALHNLKLRVELECIEKQKQVAIYKDDVKNMDEEVGQFIVAKQKSINILNEAQYEIGEAKDELKQISKTNKHNFRWLKEELEFNNEELQNLLDDLSVLEMQNKRKSVALENFLHEIKDNQSHLQAQEFENEHIHSETEPYIDTFQYLKSNFGLQKFSFPNDEFINELCAKYNPLSRENETEEKQIGPLIAKQDFLEHELKELNDWLGQQMPYKNESKIVANIVHRIKLHLRSFDGNDNYKDLVEFHEKTKWARIEPLDCTPIEVTFNYFWILQSIAQKFLQIHRDIISVTKHDLDEEESKAALKLRKISVGMFSKPKNRPSTSYIRSHRQQTFHRPRSANYRIFDEFATQSFAQTYDCAYSVLEDQKVATAIAEKIHKIPYLLYFLKGDDIKEFCTHYGSYHIECFGELITTAGENQAARYQELVSSLQDLLVTAQANADEIVRENKTLEFTPSQKEHILPVGLQPRWQGLLSSVLELVQHAEQVDPALKLAVLTEQAEKVMEQSASWFKSPRPKSITSARASTAATYISKDTNWIESTRGQIHHTSSKLFEAELKRQALLEFTPIKRKPRHVRSGSRLSQKGSKAHLNHLKKELTRYRHEIARVKTLSNVAECEHQGSTKSSTWRISSPRYRMIKSARR